MRKIAVSLFASVLLGAALVAPVAAAEGDTQTVMVMSHFCDASIQSEADFKAVEAKGKGNPVAALVQTVLACPTAVNSGDSQSNGIKDDARNFAFTVTGAEMSDDSTAAKLCETDVKLDANGDGEQSADVCLDISHYMFEGVSAGDVTVEQDSADGFRFGTLRFTPTEIDGNNDEASLVDFGDGTISLSTAGDEDNSIMLHVYSFAEMPNTDTESVLPASNGAPLAALSLLLLSGALGGAYALRRTRA